MCARSSAIRWASASRGRPRGARRARPRRSRRRRRRAHRGPSHRRGARRSWSAPRRRRRSCSCVPRRRPRAGPPRLRRSWGSYPAQIRRVYPVAGAESHSYACPHMSAEAGQGTNGGTRDGQHVALVHDRLRAAILLGELPAGQTTSQVTLARDLEVGRTPLREALRMLQREGLVVSEPNRRVRIAALSSTDAEELYVMRIALEAVAIRITVPTLTSTDFAELEGLMAQMDHYMRSDDRMGMRVPHRAFHDRFVRAAGERVTTTIGQLFDHGERYRLRYGATTPEHLGPAPRRAPRDRGRRRRGRRRPRGPPPRRTLRARRRPSSSPRSTPATTSRACARRWRRSPRAARRACGSRLSFRPPRRRARRQARDEQGRGVRGVDRRPGRAPRPSRSGAGSPSAGRSA